ncbi:hypothetical protein SKAU_G00075720 [Synaphobranchus kaupii]|uniref:Uncharacterized protein n=1 Tax=Synaphobranchus kaupii TaxID=118154 RepID=A0A9Q1G8P9_SYNKA|nr:hypothetical protein SKAU_G00075720 [Synaphobranchus kaupii]
MQPSSPARGEEKAGRRPAESVGADGCGKINIIGDSEMAPRGANSIWGSARHHHGCHSRAIGDSKSG